MRYKIFLTLLVLLFTSNLFAQAKKIEEKQMSLTVPGAPWHFILDGEDFELSRQTIKPDGENGYFLMKPLKSGINVSLFIERVKKCDTSKSCRDMVWKSGNPSWENPKNVKLGEIDGISFFEFLIPKIQGQKIDQHNIYAQFVKDGYWIDLHISKVLYKKGENNLLKNIVTSAKFETKTEKPLEDAKKAMEEWREIWDSGKYEKSYEKLAEYTQKNLNKRTWFVYWTGVRKPLGKVKSRKLISADYINSLQGLPDREGMMYQFQSSFEKANKVIETFALMREEDGTWKVANYLTNQ